MAGAKSIGLEIGWPPSVNMYYRSIVMNGSARTILSKKAREFRDCVAASVATSQKLTGRLSVSIKLHAPNRRKYDIDNRVKAILDSLEHVGLFENDEQIDRILVTRGEVIPRQGKAIIFITERPNELTSKEFLDG